MPPSPPSAVRPHGRDAGPSRPPRPVPWAARPDADPAVAVLMTSCRDPAGAARGYRTVLPRAQIWLYGHDLPPQDRRAAEAAGAVVRVVPPSSRDALVRRMLAEVDADTYILADGAGAEDVCVAPLIVAEIDGGCDLVDVARFGEEPARDAASRLLRRTVDFAFGGHGDALRSDFKACSRRFALSYRRTRARPGRGPSSARDLALHALRLRLPVGRVTALTAHHAGPAPTAEPPDRAAMLGTVVRLLVDERPRRVFGLIGLAVMAAGLAAAAPELEIRGARAALAPSTETLAALALVGTGSAIGAAGLLLDALAAARQEVRRLGAAAIPRRVDRSGPAPAAQSSVS